MPSVEIIDRQKRGETRVPDSHVADAATAPDRRPCSLRRWPSDKTEPFEILVRQIWQKKNRKPV
jgi:hypothetical protein